MAFPKRPPHFILIPFMAQGHMIPMIDIARLLAHQGVIITIFTTPLNAKRFDSVLARAVEEAGLPIQVIQLEFPAAEAGIPEGCECFDMLPSMDLGVKFFAACKMLKPLIEERIQELKPSPSCILADMCHPWANQVAEKFGVPRLMFHGFCSFSLLCIYNLARFKELDDITSDSEYFVVPDMPHQIELTKAQIVGLVNQNNYAEWKELQDSMREAENEAFGVVVNTFQDLEPDYIAQYKKAKAKKVWCVGPVSLCNKDNRDIAERGSKASISEHQCQKWLDSQGANSVIYACLGSITRLSTSQWIELGLGLEASNRPFIWVIRDAPEEFRKWIQEEKFEERIQGKGLLIQGWAPQVLILSHPSVGGFVTHCGWNSTIEGICAGVPMITWPLFAEQFLNEKLVVNVLEIGVRAGVESPVYIGYEEMAGVQVNRDETKRAIDKIMDEREEAEMRRTRAKELGKKARKALEEGGSSYLDIMQLIQDIMEKVHRENQPTSMHNIEEEDS
ncbi:OLC1v1034430C1 [Oldenlandia corymbosa var. corymbosa]|uniref:Glycosyltransferase n=1 Tax=Oldenlandia corymbosa var. corymbosa TaxID=529605 RepID=A0AAV1CRB7_OLDCO|nr:OLC1v1034430C1 [Oldenlandia corymbosa var. corymbosa]